MKIRKTLSASEAVLGFAAWLTTRDETTKMGAKDDCAPIVGLATRFCETNGLPDIRENWADALTHPIEIDIPVRLNVINTT